MPIAHREARGESGIEGRHATSTNPRCEGKPVVSRAFRKTGRPSGPKAQSLVEFALFVPTFLMLVMGIIELGRLVAVYTGAASASREAARYGASVGTNISGIERYQDCQGIREAAQRMSVLAGIADPAISIQYDNPETGFFDPDCPPSQISLGDRIIVRVTLTYQPLVPLFKIPPVPLESETRRTVLKDIYVK